MKRIDELCGCAWNVAIVKVATVVERRLGVKYTLREDWDALEHLAMDLDIRFDENGEIVNK